MNTYIKLAEAITENGGVECEQSPDTFFLDAARGDPNEKYKVKTAKEICGRCPVSMLCLEYALDSREEEGIWGGLTPKGRENILRGRRASANIHRGDSWESAGQRVRFAG